MKIKEISTQSKASLAYLVGNLVTKGIGIITVPIFTRMLTTSEMGITTTYSSWYAILYSVVTLSLCSGSLSVAMMEYKDRRDEYESACLFLSTLSGIFFIFIYVLFSKNINELLTLPSSLVCLMLFSFIFCPALDIWYVRQRYEYNYKATVTVSVLLTIISAFLSIICVVVANKFSDVSLGNVKVLSQGIIMLIFSTFFYYCILKRGKCYFDKGIWKFALKLSLPLIIHSISKNILDISDRLMIAKMCGQSEAGIYGTIYTIATMSLIIWNAINSAIIPFMFEKLEAGEYVTLRKLINSILFLFGGIAIVMTLFAPEIVLMLTTKEYYEAIYLIPPISAGIYLTAVYNIYGNMLMFKKKSIHIMIATIISAVINLVLNYLFVSKYGYIAAAYTTLITFLILSILQCIMQKIVYKKTVLNDTKIILLSVFISIVCTLCNFLYDYFIIRYFLIGAIFVLGVINRKKIMGLLKKVK